MSELSRQARKANRDKAERLTRADPHQKVDASSWTPPEAMDTEEQTGAKPISRQARKHGGKVEGESVKARADLKPRHGQKREHRDMGGSAVPTERFQFQPGPSRLSRMAGLKTGGTARPKKAGGGGLAYLSPALAALKDPKALTYLSPVAALAGAGHDEDKAAMKTGGGLSMDEIDGTRPTGGRRPRKDGGRANKGKTNINIIIDAGKGQPQGGPPPMPMPMPPRPPMPMPQPAMAGPPPMGGPPMPPGGPGLPSGMTPPMPRKRGGRAYFKSEAGAGSGLGRMQKTDAC